MESRPQPQLGEGDPGCPGPFGTLSVGISVFSTARPIRPLWALLRTEIRPFVLRGLNVTPTEGDEPDRGQRSSDPGERELRSRGELCHLGAEGRVRAATGP